MWRKLAAVVAGVWVLARFVPLVFVALVVVTAAASALIGGVLTISVLKRHTAMPVLRRRIAPLALVQAWDAVEAARREENVQAPPKPLVHTHNIQLKLEQLLTLALRDFVKSWYASISTDEVFTRKADANMRVIMKELLLRAQRVDLVTLLMKKILPIFTMHIHKYRAAVVQVRRVYFGAQGEAEVTESEELDKLVAQHYRKGKLHRALSKTSAVDTELDYLRRVMELLLPVLCPQRDYNSSLYRLFLREVFATKIIHPVLAMIADPDYLNHLIDDFASKELSDRKKAVRFRETLDQFFTGNVSGEKETEANLSRILSFDEFLRVIRECNTVLDAKRIRHQIMTEVRKRQLQIRNRRPDDILPGGVRVREAQRYINRLIIARKRAERRIEELGGKRIQPTSDEVEDVSVEQQQNITLATVFRSNTALFYFMEFMERNQAMRQLQFLLVAESFKRFATSLSPEDEQHMLDDAKHIYQLYLAPDAPEKLTSVSEKIVADVRAYVDQVGAGAADHDSILRAQRAVFDAVNAEYFTKFLQSDLFFRYSSDPAAKAELAADFERQQAAQQEVASLKSADALQDIEPADDSITMAAVESALQNIVSDKPTIDTSSAASSSTALDVAVFSPEMERKTSVYDRVEQDSDDDLEMAPPSELIQAKAMLQEINDNIDALKHQRDIIDTLIRKASKKDTGDELRILNINKQKVQEELRQLLVKRSKYEDQEDKSVITPGLWTVHISSSTIGYENGKPFALYVIEVHRADPENPSGWIVARRYREFNELHEKLRRQYPIMREFELPGKHMLNLFKLKTQFVEERRVALESYLQRLLDQNEVCRSIELREFLYQREYANHIGNADVGSVSDRPEFGDITAQPKADEDGLIPRYLRAMAVDTFVKPFSDVLEDIFSGPPAVIDAASSTLQKSKLSQQPAGNVDLSFNPVAPSMLQAASVTETTGPSELDDNAANDADNTGNSNAEGRETFATVAEPLCNLLIEMFELKERSSYLRRQAVLVILQQLLGGTIERKVVDNVNWLVSEEQLCSYLDRIQAALWPDGQLSGASPVRTGEQRETTKRQAKAKLMNVIAEIFTGMVGGDNSRRGASRVFEALQSLKLNKHLMFTIFDEVVGALFPELLRIGTGSAEAPPTSTASAVVTPTSQPSSASTATSAAAASGSRKAMHARNSSTGARSMIGHDALEALAAASEAFQQQAGGAMMFG